MLFILAGEGPSDLGSLDQAGVLKKGPMTWIVDCICRVAGEFPEYELLTESQLKRLGKADRRNIMPSRPEREKDTEKIWLVARYLGGYAKLREEPTGVVFFKDSDGTRKAPRDRWEQMVRAMEKGFDFAGFSRGVAMVPRPKSEAWLLAYFQKELPGECAYRNAHRFEEMPGNDGSPNSLKALLAKALGGIDNPYTRIDEAELAEVDWEAVDIPSFRIFLRRLQNVIAMMSYRSCPHSLQDTLLSVR